MLAITVSRQQHLVRTVLEVHNIQPFAHIPRDHDQARERKPTAHTVKVTVH